MTKYKWEMRRGSFPDDESSLSQSVCAGPAGAYLSLSERWRRCHVVSTLAPGSAPAGPSGPDSCVATVINCFPGFGDSSFKRWAAENPPNFTELKVSLAPAGTSLMIRIPAPARQKFPSSASGPRLFVSQVSGDFSQPSVPARIALRWKVRSLPHGPFFLKSKTSPHCHGAL